MSDVRSVTRKAVTSRAVTSRAVTSKDPAALRHVVDLALRGIRAKARTPHPARPHGEARWVMSSDGVIGAPRTEENPGSREEPDPTDR